MKALVVDDSAVMRKIVIRSLNSVGVTDVAEAGDGEEALEVFGDGGADIVLSDWNMPKMNGLEMLRALRGQGATVPVIMVTTEAERGKVLEAIQAGATDYLAKPFESDVLRQKLEKYVGAI